MDKKNLTSLIITLVGTVNALLMSFGYYHLTNSSLQEVDQVVSWVVTFIGVVISHRKPIKSYFTK